MTENHPISPPAELVQQWRNYCPSQCEGGKPSPEELFAARAAQWGADQELEAIQKEIITQAWFADPRHRLAQLRAARRPKPPTLKEQALAIIEQNETKSWATSSEDWAVIRRALEETSK